jgi:hypothetical protein
MNIIRAYRRLREIFLAGPYDVLWIVENDVIPPPDALEKMLAVDADIVYAPYCFRRGPTTLSVMQPGTRNPMTELGKSWARRFAAGEVVDSGGLGFGCTLIRRPVLERLEFRSEGGGGDADSCLAVDAPRAGFTQKTHLGVPCGHKRPDGVCLWPQAAPPYYMRVGVSVPRTRQIRALRAFVAFGEHGEQLLVRPGEIAVVDFELADSLAPVGIVELV